MIQSKKTADSRWLSIENEVGEYLSSEQGIRIGEASVVSTRVHAAERGKPGEIMVLPGDAGQVFYHREKQGEIIHIDCFHELGRLDQTLLARDLINFLEKFQGEHSMSEQLKDYIDIQTASGGGRLTGSLEYGKKKTLRDAHLNHVHLALYLEPENYFIILFLIDKLEKGIMKQGLNLKKIEKVIVKPHKSSKNSSEDSVDTSVYATQADSLLKGNENKNNKSEYSRGSERTEESNEQPNQEKSGEEGDSNSGVNNGKSESAGSESTHGAASPGEAGQEFNHGNKLPSKQLLDVAEIRSECQDDPERVNELMEKLEKGYPVSEMASEYPKTYNELNKLKRNNLIKETSEKIYLTEYGKVLLKYLKRHLREIEKNLKRLARKLPEKKGKIPKKIKDSSNRFSKHFFGKGGIISREGNELEGPIAVSETVIKSAIRSYQDGEAFSIKPGDLHVVKPQKYTSLDLCLLIDASGSMAGRRMKEVKILAEQLLVSTRDKVAIVAFQEDRVEIKVPFTRDRLEMKNGLFNLKAAGLTPMAHGLKEGEKYIEKEGGKNSMLVLITDGLPTICGGGADPFAETLKVASEISQSKSKFTCIGLEPNVSFLRKLADEAGGSLYMVDELRKESLLQAIKQERQGV